MAIHLTSILSVMLVICLAATASGVVKRISVPCTNLTHPDECDYCVKLQQKGLTSCERKLGMDVRMLGLKFTVEYPAFSWTFENVGLRDTSNLKITLYAWDATDDPNEPGFPIPGCCGIDMKVGRCQATTCLRGKVFYRVASPRCSAFPPAPFAMPPLTCGDDRELSRYLYLCPNKEMRWMKALHCECVKYDTKTGGFMVTNDSQPFTSTSYNVWLNLQRNRKSERFSQVCLFTLPKDQVMKEGIPIDPSRSKEPVLFQRGVFNMPNRLWVNGSVIDNRRNHGKVDCQAWRYNGTSLFRLTSTNADNQTFTCMVMWPNGTDILRPFSSHVKCMPPNETFVPHSSVHQTGYRDDTLTKAVIGVVAGAAAVALLAIVVCVVRRNLRAFLKETKSLPEHMQNVIAFTNPPEIHDSYEKEKVDLIESDESRVKQGLAVQQTTKGTRSLILQNYRDVTDLLLANSSSRDVRASDKRIQREDEYSDSEDEGEGGRKNVESHRKKKRKVDEGDGKPAGDKGEEEKTAKADGKVEVTSEKSKTNDEEKMETQQTADAPVKVEANKDEAQSIDKPDSASQSETGKKEDTPAPDSTKSAPEAPVQPAAAKDPPADVKPSNDDEKMEQ